jgi:uncharacterized protein (TIGR04255 family)
MMQKLRNPPIVEAVLDIECDLPTGFNFQVIKEAAHEAFRSKYPTPRTTYSQQHTIQLVTSEEPTPAAAPTSEVAVQGYQFWSEDGHQLVQIRTQGFSFNRLAPYSSFDDYLPEIKRVWLRYIELVPVTRIKTIRLRYINRMMLPMTQRKVDLDQFLKIGPRAPDEDNFTLAGFASQLSAVENKTKEGLNLVLVAEAPIKDHLPVILDISVASPFQPITPGDWPAIETILISLRQLKNRVFENTVTQKCIELFL